MSKTRNDSDVAFIQALAEVLAENDLTEIDVKREYGENDAMRVRVSRAKPAPVMAQMAAPVAAPVAAAAAPAAAPVASAAPVADANANAVKSPMVGTAYLSAEPGADTFVKVGDKVTEGQTLMIIEAMKTMNHIPSPKAGTVKRIIVADGSPVEFGAPLMVVE